jgi:hypothetical protein
VNHGRPPVPATPRPGEFNARGGGSGTAREAGRAETSGGHTNNPVHPKDLPAYQRPAAPNTGNTKLDQKYQKQQEDMARKQDQQRQKLQQQQDREHQQYTKQNANEARNQQLEQRSTRNKRNSFSKGTYNSNSNYNKGSSHNNPIKHQRRRGKSISYWCTNKTAGHRRSAMPRPRFFHSTKARSD